MTKVTTICGLLAVMATLASGQVVINEFNTGAPDWFEVCNLGTAPVDVSGWYLYAWWDNPSTGGALADAFGFQFPGAGGSGTTVLAPGQCAVISDDPMNPVVPAGALFFGPAQGAPIYPFFSGLPGSAVLADDQGNGVDYVAWSNANTFQAPLEVATLLSLANPSPVPTVWNGGGEPVFPDGINMTTALGSSNGDVNYRHSPIDNDDASDWTNDVGNATPGALNPLQAIAPAGAPIAPTASFSESSANGIAPFTVNFTNTTQGEITIEQALGGSVQWDMDQSGQLGPPGTMLMSTHHAGFTFPSAGTFTVELTVIDLLGAMSQTTKTITAVQGGANPQVGCFVQDFENFPPLVTGPNGGMIPDPTTGIEFRSGGSNGRFRVIDRNVIVQTGPEPWFALDATPSAGPTILVLDSTGGGVTNDIILHFDAISLGGEFVIEYSLIENNDETNPEDIIGLQDGVTPGMGVTNTGTSNGLPGIDGFAEVLLNDWNSGNINRQWQRFSHTIDAAFLAANGLAANSDMRLIIRQRDNVTFEGNDGLAIDQIVIRALNPTPGPGQPGVAGAALMDVNFARNGNCSEVGNPNDPNGPFFTNVVSGGNFDFTFDGEANQPIILLAGTALNPGVFSLSTFLPGAGQIDVGTFLPAPPFVNIQILADGNQMDFLNSLFNTGNSGVIQISLPASFPPGQVFNMQAVIFNSSTVIRATNAVQINVI